MPLDSNLTLFALIFQRSSSIAGILSISGLIKYHLSRFIEGFFHLEVDYKFIQNMLVFFQVFRLYNYYIGDGSRVMIFHFDAFKFLQLG